MLGIQKLSENESPYSDNFRIIIEGTHGESLIFCCS